MLNLASGSVALPDLRFGSSFSCVWMCTPKADSSFAAWLSNQNSGNSRVTVFRVGAGDGLNVTLVDGVGNSVTSGTMTGAPMAVNSTYVCAFVKDGNDIDFYVNEINSTGPLTPEVTADASSLLTYTATGAAFGQRSQFSANDKANVHLFNFIFTDQVLTASNILDLTRGNSVNSLGLTWSEDDIVLQESKEQVSITGDTTSGSAIVTNSDTSEIRPGYEVSGTGIPASTTVLTVDSATQFTMSDNATATNTGVAIAAIHPLYMLNIANRKQISAINTVSYTDNPTFTDGNTAPSISTSTNLAGMKGGYSLTNHPELLNITEFGIPWAAIVSDDTLPAGITLDADRGVLTGQVPFVAASQTNGFTLTNSEGSSQADSTLSYVDFLPTSVKLWAGFEKLNGKPNGTPPAFGSTSGLFGGYKISPDAVVQNDVLDCPGNIDYEQAQFYNISEFGELFGTSDECCFLWTNYTVTEIPDMYGMVDGKATGETFDNQEGIQIRSDGSEMEVQLYTYTGGLPNPVQVFSTSGLGITPGIVLQSIIVRKSDSASITGGRTLVLSIDKGDGNGLVDYIATSTALNPQENTNFYHITIGNDRPSSPIYKIGGFGVFDDPNVDLSNILTEPPSGAAAGYSSLSIGIGIW